MKWTCFSPVCRRMCTFMLPEVEKHFRQHWHSKALIPVCVFMCAVRVLLTAKARKHCLHLKGFSWVWMRMWRTRSLGFLNSLVQYGQPCQRTPFSSLMEPGKEGRVKQLASRWAWCRNWKLFLLGIYPSLQIINCPVSKVWKMKWQIFLFTLNFDKHVFFKLQIFGIIHDWLIN